MTKEELKLLKQTRKENNLCIHCGILLHEPDIRNRGTCASCHYVGRLAAGEGGWRWKDMREVLDNYGPTCACCGELNPLMLTIDHTQGGGNIHRKEERKTSNEWLKAVIRDHFPPTYQVLCYNCNMSKNRTKDGKCAHELEKRNYED
jgi:hypothetical protein